MAAIERREKERLVALKVLVISLFLISDFKNNDEEAYLKLLSETKNDRLSHLMDQTSTFLGEIGALVSKQQVSLFLAIQASLQRTDSRNKILLPSVGLKKKMKL